MKTKKSELKHITGDLAYRLYWQQYYECRPLLSTVKAIDLNLEIITDADLTILAFRYDHPDDMQWMVINAGQWQIVGQETMNPELLEEVKTLLGRLRTEICLN